MESRMPELDAMVPSHTLPGMKDYVEHRVPPGHFLTAVLSNDLKESFARADDDNRDALFHIVAWLWNNAPISCWGSPENVAAWLAGRKHE